MTNNAASVTVSSPRLLKQTLFRGLQGGATLVGRKNTRTKFPSSAVFAVRDFRRNGRGTSTCAMSTNEQGEIVSEEVKKSAATLVPSLIDADRAPRASFDSKPILFAGGPARPESHPLAAARAGLAAAEEKFREASFQFQRELQTSVRLETRAPGAWCCGKLRCEGKMQMGDGMLRCAVCGRTCSANDEHLKWRAYPAETVFADENAPARIRAKRAAMEQSGKSCATKNAGNSLRERTEKNLELMAESGRAGHKQ